MKLTCYNDVNIWDRHRSAEAHPPLRSRQLQRAPEIDPEIARAGGRTNPVRWGCPKSCPTCSFTKKKIDRIYREQKN